MSARREVMSYIGVGAIGGIVGYYVGAQELLGIQSEKVVRYPETDQQPEQTTEQPTEQSTEQPTEHPTETSASSIATFEEGSLTEWKGTETAKITDSKSYKGNQSMVVVDQNGNYDGIGNTTFKDFDFNGNSVNEVVATDA